MGFRESVPPSLQAIMQNGLLDRTFDDALIPTFLYDNLAELKPWSGGIGSRVTFTRPGLMTPVVTPITGQDASVDAYGVEQYSLNMDQWGNSIDTNMALSAMALSSKFLEDNATLAINAAQSLNRVARNALYAAYGTDRTWATATSTASTTLAVAETAGFQQAVVALATTGSNPGEGLTGKAVNTLVPVSGSATIAVTVNGVANTVTGCSTTSGPGNLTLGSAVTASIGWAVVNTQSGPVSYRAAASTVRNTAYELTVADVATLALFQSGVTRLRTMNIPTINGAYTAHVTPQTVQELFADAAFRTAYQGRADSSAYVNFKIGDGMGDGAEFLGRFAGIDWIMNNETPTVNPTGSVPVYRCILVGKEALIKGPFEQLGSLVSSVNAGSTVQIDVINGIARILRAPLDRLGQVLSSTWSWIGGYSVGTDLLTGDGAAYKRAVVLEHA